MHMLQLLLVCCICIKERAMLLEGTCAELSKGWLACNCLHLLTCLLKACRCVWCVSKANDVRASRVGIGKGCMDGFDCLHDVLG